MDRQSVGRQGEDIAVNYLKSKGFNIIDRRYRVREGEIDIVAEREERLYFIEVKTRRSLSYGYPYEAVNDKKLQRMRSVALKYLEENKIRNKDISFGVVSVLMMGDTIKIEYVEDV